MSTSDRKYRRSPKNSLLLPDKHSHDRYHRDNHFHSSEGGFSGASFVGAVFNLSTTIAGAGIMALPATFKQLGVIPGLIMIILGAVLTDSSIDMILLYSKAAKSSSYSGLVGDAFGAIGRTLLQVMFWHERGHRKECTTVED